MIIEIFPTKEQIKYADKIVRGWVLGFEREDFGKEYDRMFGGLLMETVICDLLNQPRPKTDKPDEGDVKWRGQMWDVKTVVRSVSDVLEDYAHNVNESQYNNPNAGYLFCSFNKIINRGFICGWMTKEEFKQKAVFRFNKDKIERKDGTYLKPKGNLGVYITYQEEVHEFKNLQEFING
jgi:hypothetical protein